MARPKATVTAQIQSNMDEIARAERNARDLLEVRTALAALYHHTGILVQQNLDLVEDLRASNARLERRGPSRRVAA